MADFAVIKEKVSIEQAAEALGLPLQKSGSQFRAPCPACGTGGPRALAITPAKGLAYCFSAGVGGDLLFLWGHVRKCSLADAGEQIADTFRIGNSGTRRPVNSERVNQSTVPDVPQAPTSGFQPLDYLEAEHPAVSAAGFNPEETAALGIGYANKGILRGTVAVPIRDEHGTLLGYIGVTEAKCPSKGFLNRNVVPLKRPA